MTMNHNKKSFKTISKQMLKNSSIYPLSQIVHTKSSGRKIWWMLVFLVSIFGSLYQITTFLLNYLKYPVQIDLQVENNQVLDFPAVTFCNLNRMDNKYVKCMIENSHLSKCNVSGGFGSGGPPITLSERAYSTSCKKQFGGKKNENMEDMANFLMQYMSLTYEDRKYYGYQLNELTGFCLFNNVPCKEEYFSYFQTLQYGNCFTFNRKKNNSDVLKVPSSIKTSGLEIILNTERFRYIDVTPSAGIRILIHNPNEDPNPQEGGINVSPGFEISIKIKQMRYRRLKSPYTDKCIDYENNPEIQGKNQNECVQICIQELNIANCSCVDPTISVLNDNQHCNISNTTDACCLDDVIHNIASYGLPCECPLACLVTSYEKLLSVSKWPAPRYKHTMSEYMVINKKNTARLKVSYSTSNHITYDQNPMFQDSELYSNLGSLLSLWLGFSLLIIFEISEILMNLCLYIFKKI